MDNRIRIGLVGLNFGQHLFDREISAGEGGKYGSGSGLRGRQDGHEMHLQ